MPAGDYTVVETQPASYTDGAETVGSVGGILAVNDQISAIPLGAGVDATGYNFGELGVIVSGTVFYDRSRNGALDVGDTGIGGVTIRLIDQFGIVVATTTTDGNGFYQFDNVPPGDYTIAESQPAGYGDPLVGPFAPNSRPITVTNTSVTNQNFGDTLSTLAGLVYVDTNTSGDFTAGEPGIGGVTVRLLSPGIDGSFGTADDQVVQTTTTAGDGTYLFSDLPDGVYQIVETQPASYTDGSETIGDAGGVLVPTDTITAIVLPSGVDRVSYNFGELVATAPGTSFIAGTVYVDTNNNGVQDGGEPGIPGVTITLTDGVNPPIVLTTDASGGYLFSGLTTGVDYTVTESQPPSYATGLENPGNVVLVTALPLAGSTGNNFGEIPGTISGVVYHDVDSSGALSAGDVRLPGVTVTLQDGSGSPVNDPTTGLPYVATTLADGSYLFVNLPAGSYRVVETQPSGYNQGTNTPGAGAALGGTDQIDVTLPAGGSSPDNNFGEVGPGISGTVWVDTNRDGVIDAGEAARVGGVTITLLDSNGVLVATATTQPDGSYQFTNIPLGSYTIVETQPNIYGSTTSNSIAVTLPAGGLTDQNFGEVLSTLDGSVYVDVNGNGQRDPGEQGISGVTIDLVGTDVNGAPVTRTTTTDLTGGYAFSDLPAGSYRVVETQPASYPDGLERIGSEGGNTATNDQIDSIPLGAGIDASGYDFGEGGSTLAGSVYVDLDNDGVRDAGEPGISGVTVVLSGTDTGGNPFSRVLTTDASGNYLFTGVPSGTFTVSEAQPPPWGDGIDTPGSAGGTAGNDSISAIVIGAAVDLTGYNFGEVGGSISGTVFIGFDPGGIPQPGDPRLQNITVVLISAGPDGILGTADDTSTNTLTDASGGYLFPNLPAGSYRVVVVRSTLPPGIAEIFDRDGGTDSRTVVSLAGGQNLTVVNFSYGSPTSVTLVSLTATREGSAIAVRWATATEENTWGFQVYRSATGDRADAELITPALIPAQGGGQQGGSYEVIDSSAQPGVTYSYWLVETENGGTTHEYGPVQSGLPSVGAQYIVTLPSVTR
jgi:large repetitive protein